MKAEGKNAVKEALTAGSEISKILIQKESTDRALTAIVAMAKERGVRVTFVDKRALDRESVTGRHQGAIAYLADFAYCDAEEILAEGPSKGESRFILVLDGVEDPHNLGSIIRVAECMGVDGIVIGSRRAVGVNETVIRASAGAAAHVKIAQVGNINDFIRTLKDNFITVLALDMDGENIAKADLCGDVAIIIGGEGKGVSRLTRDLSDGIVSIPMFGKVSSLNASVATGMAVYECVRQRKNK